MNQGEPTAGRPRHGEEIANSVTHGLGAVLGLAGLVVLARSASRNGARTVVGCIVFGVALVVLYRPRRSTTRSGRSPRAKAVLRVLDHSAIFLLDRGHLHALHAREPAGPWGWSLFGVVWGLALAGIALRARLAAAAHRALRRSLPRDGVVRGRGGEAAPRPVAPGGIALLGPEGSPTPRASPSTRGEPPYDHAIWHGFVLAGSAFHYAAVLLYVARA